MNWFSSELAWAIFGAANSVLFLYWVRVVRNEPIGLFECICAVGALPYGPLFTPIQIALILKDR